MASISKDKSGNKIIQFMLGKQRKTVWVGKMQLRTARTWKDHIEELVNAKNEGRNPYNETSVWVGRLADKYHKKLSRVDLVAERTAAREQGKPTLKSFLDSYIQKRSDVKGSTAKFYGHTRRNLLAYFG